MANITKERLAELLATARANAAASKLEATETAIAGIQHEVDSGVLEVDLSTLGITGAENLLEEEADVLMECIAAGCENRNKDLDDYDREQEAIHATPSRGTEQHSTDVADIKEDEQHSTDGVKILGVARDDIIYTDEQVSAQDEVEAGRNVVIIGKAGSGKTSTMRGAMKKLMASGRVGSMKTTTKWLTAGSPGCAVVSYTRKAVNNIRHAMPEELKANTITLHKLLEFKPCYYEVLDEETGKLRKTMRFEPSRNANNPLPDSLKCVAFEESSMIGIDLHKQWLDAMPHEHQAIYLGDIQQLPPVFGSAILGYKMLELKVVQLTKVHRQAMESPILAFALSLLDGDSKVYDSKVERFKQYHPVFQKEVDRIRVPSLDKFARGDELVIQVWQKKLKEDTALYTTVQQFGMWEQAGYYNPEDDIILLPFNKSFGTIELNKGIAQHLGRKRGAVVHEVIAGFNKYYLAVGDRVLYDKEDAFIIDIVRNDEYIGKRPQTASRLLDRWGHLRTEEATAEMLATEKAEQAEEADGFDLAAIEKFMSVAADQIEERTAAASHIITLRVPTSDQDVEINKAAEVNALLGGYAITVHKSQGSEWDKVFFIMHQSHAVMNQRELLYTACTRAAKKLHIICEPDTFERGVRSQAIKGNTLEEKAEYFKGKKEDVKDKLVGEKVEGAIARETHQKIVETPVFIAPTDRPPVALFRMSKFVPDAFKEAANAALKDWWQQALNIWGESINPMPYLDYELQRSRTVGLACLGANMIRLNPVYCIAAIQDPAIMKEMIGNALAHEVCHFVAHRYSRERGHDAGWIMAMKLMKQPPEQYYIGDTLPNWANAFADIVAEVKAKLANDGAYTGDDYEVQPDDEV